MLTYVKKCDILVKKLFIIFLALPGGKSMIKYVCEDCSEEFENRRDYEKHKLEHKLAKKLENAPKGACVCPECKGEGGDYGTDGCDWRTCSTCGGKGIVIAEHVREEKLIYKKI